MFSENIQPDFDKIVKYWKESSEDDFETMLSLFNAKKFAWALFVGHISVEKLLKALYITKKQKLAPFTHNLYRIAEMSLPDVSEEYANWLDTITTFNINARYDDYKREFQSVCTPEFTSLWIDRIKLIRKWILEML